MSHHIKFTNGTLNISSLEFTSSDETDSDHTSQNIKLIMDVGYDYNSSPSDSYNELVNYLEEIMPLESERNDMLDFCSSFFERYNKRRQALILTGNNNLVELLQYTFGNYCATVPNKIFDATCKITQKQLINIGYIKGKHLLVNEEMMSTSKLRLLLIMELLIGYQIIVENLDKELENIVPRFNMVLKMKEESVKEFQEKIKNEKKGKFIELFKIIHLLESKDKLLNCDKYKMDFMLMLLNRYHVVKNAVNGEENVYEDDSTIFID